MSVSERIRTLRIEKGMTQEELGEYLGVGKATVQKYESGQIQNLKTAHIKKLCLLFGKKPHHFIFDDEELMMPDKEKIIDSVADCFGDSTAQLLERVERLNEEGRKKVTDYVCDLLEIGKYR